MITKDVEESVEEDEEPLTKRRNTGTKKADMNFAAPPGIMNLLSLNCRGLGNPQTVRELHALVKHEDPSVSHRNATRTKES